MNMLSRAQNERRAISETTNHHQDLEKALLLCVRKSRKNIERLADQPKSAAWAADGNYFAFPEGFYDIGNWTSSFFTGMALLAWRETEDEFFLKQTLRLAPFYREKVFQRFRDTHHDLGFLYSLYSVALYKLTAEPAHREIALRAAAVLARRFNPLGNFIRAWGCMDTEEHANMAIIDSLMNLPLLYWASNESGNPAFRDIAVRHADTVLKYFIRPDYSVIQALRFDLKTGQPLAPDSFCGHSTRSYWARGAAWAIYGFGLSYACTRNEKYVQAAAKLAKQFIAQLDNEAVPVWDFRLPPGKPRTRDASAAAIAVCGLQELARHHAADTDAVLAKDRLLNRLCREDCLDSTPECPGLLKCAYGDQPAYSSWGDYFLMEALVRDLKGVEAFW